MYHPLVRCRIVRGKWTTRQGSTPPEPQSLRGNYRKWDPVSMEKAMVAVEKGESIRHVSEKYHVPRATLYDYVSGRTQIGTKSGPKTYLTAEEEEELVNFLIRCSRVGYPHTKKEVLAIVQRVVDGKGIESVVSNGWWERFCRRHPKVSLRSAAPLSLARAMASDPVVIQNYYDELEDTLASNDIFDRPAHLFNCDESGMPLNPKCPKIVCEMGAKNPSYLTGNGKSQITVLACISAAGYSMPPFVIFDRKTLNPQYTTGEVPGTLYGLSPNGWIDKSLFSEWFFNHFLVYAPPNRPLLLLMDGHSSHYCPEMIRIAAAEKIILFVLPPNTTHLTQPLDKGCFGPLKKYWQTVCHYFITRNPGRYVSRFDFSELFAEAWYKAMTLPNCMSSFRITGVCPFNRLVIKLPSVDDQSEKQSLAERSGLAYIPLYSPARSHASRALLQPTNFKPIHRRLSSSDPNISERLVGAETSVPENCLIPVRTVTAISKYLKPPLPPASLPTKNGKSSGRILTSFENMSKMEEKERKKEEEARLKQLRKMAREEKKKLKLEERMKKSQKKKMQEEEPLNSLGQGKKTTGLTVEPPGESSTGRRGRKTTGLIVDPPKLSTGRRGKKTAELQVESQPEQSHGPTTRQRKKTAGLPLETTSTNYEPVLDLNLHQSDRDDILNGSFLNDRVIEAAQKMMKRQFPNFNGFQLTILGQNLSFVPVSRNVKSVQILHTGKVHWICVSCDGAGKIMMMDSKSTMGITVETVLQVAKIYSIPSNHSSLKVHRLSVQQQEGTSDCGLFSIAFCLEQCLGRNLEKVFFEQKKMRGHLHKCLKDGVLVPFPSSPSELLLRPRKGVLTIEVFCSCKMPAQFDATMVRCDKCNKWYHCSCVKLDSESVPEIWECPNCLI